MTRTPGDDRLVEDQSREERVEQPADEQALADAGLPQEGQASSTRGRRRLSGLGHRLYNGEAGFDVVGNSRLIYRITAVVVLLCLLSMLFRGFNFGIDFEGGNSFRLPGSEQQLEEVRAAA
jgi:preprotein translocase subunit SecF